MTMYSRESVWILHHGICMYTKGQKLGLCELPLGIHVKRDKHCEVINRGCPKDITRLAYGSAEIRGIE